MCMAHVEAVRAYLAPLGSSSWTTADLVAVHSTAADLTVGLALVAECGPGAVATGAVLHSLFAQLVGLVRMRWLWHCVEDSTVALGLMLLYSMPV